MNNEIIVNAEAGETRVALLERSQFNEFHIERTSTRSVVGNVIKARVTRVLPGMQAAFVDIGLEKAGFLYVGDYFEADAPRTGRGRGRRTPPPIDTLLSEGQEIVVQIAKEPIGTKGARITSHISIAGRHLVLTPWSKRVGVSRRIDSDRERRRLREVVERLRSRDLGFIIRTAGDGLKESDLEADVSYLSTVWKEIQEKETTASAPAVLYREPDLPQRVLRDFASASTRRIVIDNPQVHEDLIAFSKRFVSDPQPVIEHYQGKQPIFDHFGFEAQIHANLERKVPLKSGGSLVIDQSEALTAIDVNSGRYVGKHDLEETVYRTNLEAVKEVVHQLRFRNIGGLIIIDLIDMESRDNREKVYRTLQDAVRQDKAKTNILKISELGLVEMTRKRTRENLVQALCDPCPSCEGRGYVLSAESVAYKVMRAIRKDIGAFCGQEVAVTVSPQVAHELLGEAADSLASLSEELGRPIEVRARPGLHQEQFEILALGEGVPVEIPLGWLEERKPDEEEDEATGNSLTVEALPTTPTSPELLSDTPADASALAEPDAAPAEAVEDLERAAETPPDGEEPAALSDAPLAQEDEGEASATPAIDPEPQALDEAADSPILPGPPTKPASEDS